MPRRCAADECGDTSRGGRKIPQRRRDRHSAAAQVSSPAPAAKYPPAREVSRPLSPLHAFLGIDPVTGEFKPPNAVAPKATPPAQTANKGTAPSEPGAASEVEADQGSSGESPLRDILTRAAESGELPPGNTRIGDTTIDELRAEVTKAVDSGDDQALQAALGKVTGNLGNGALALPGAAIFPGSHVGVFVLSTRDRGRGPLLRVGGPPAAPADRS